MLAAALLRYDIDVLVLLLLEEAKLHLHQLVHHVRLVLELLELRLVVDIALLDHSPGVRDFLSGYAY